VTGDGDLGVGQAKCILANKLFYPFQLKVEDPPVVWRAIMGKFLTSVLLGLVQVKKVRSVMGDVDAERA